MKIFKIKKLTEKQKRRLERKEETFQELLWRNEVIMRDNNKCAVCTSLNINKELQGINKQVHHIIPRQYKELQFELSNGLLLCYHHHKANKMSAHQNALWFAEWLKRNKIEQYNYLLIYIRSHILVNSVNKCN